MKRVAILISMLIIPALSFAAELGSARISLLQGDVQIQTEDTGEWVAATINLPLREGDRLWAPEGSRAELQIQGGVYVRIGSATALDILALQEDSSHFYLNGGHTYINNRQGGIDHIQIDMPRSSVGCYDNSLILIDASEKGNAEISVIRGYAVAENSAGKTRIESGTTLYLAEDATADISPLAPPDDWESWNRERDKHLASASRSLRYLPEELDDYAYDFDNHGKWVYVTDYGYAWTPFNVSLNWSPYRDGRWSWVGGDYVWISYDLWGWVPHHYGRWAFVANFGWCWVPPPRKSVYWSPGYVGWVHSPSYVAWVPLAPGEIYYGRGYYGPRSIDIRSLGPNRIETRSYRNSNFRNAVTIINRDTFISGRRLPVRFRGNPFRAADAVIGPPAIPPTRATAMPAIRQIPPGRRPPARVRNLSIQEIKRERGVIHERTGGSVFRSGPAPTLPVRRQNEPRSILRGQPGLPPAGTRRNIPSRTPATASPAQSRPAAPSGAIPPRSQHRGEPRWQEPVHSRRPAVPGPATAPASPAAQRRPAGITTPPLAPGKAPPTGATTPGPHAPGGRSDTRGGPPGGAGRR